MRSIQNISTIYGHQVELYNVNSDNTHSNNRAVIVKFLPQSRLSSNTKYCGTARLTWNVSLHE
jgi:hypothetical protein